MAGLGGRGALVIALGAALVFGACSSSSSKGGDGTSAPTTTNLTPTTSTNVVPSPFAIRQRFGTGSRWEFTVDAVQHTGADYTVTIDVLNEAPDAAAFAAGTPGLFTVLDQFPQTRQDYAHLKQIPSTTKLSTLQIPGNATRRIMVSFAGVAPTGRYAVLWVHGHLLPGTDDSSVCLAAAC